MELSVRLRRGSVKISRRLNHRACMNNGVAVSVIIILGPRSFSRKISSASEGGGRAGDFRVCFFVRGQNAVVVTPNVRVFGS